MLNQPRYQGASILLARENFGCGSSRGHAPWALADYGFRVVIAPSFAEIFFNNCFRNGLLPIVLPEREVDALFHVVTATPGFRMAVSLQDQLIRLADGTTIGFEVDPFRKYRLINGLDDIGLALQHADKVRAYEAVRRQQEPWAV